MGALKAFAWALVSALRIFIFLARLRLSRRDMIIFLDYDGTLAPFVVNRDEAFLAPGVAAALNALVAAPRVRVVFVTGRETSSLVQLLSLSGFHHPVEMWGQHGLERRRHDGTVEFARLPARQERGLEIGRALTADLAGEQRELKQASVAIHWRGLAEADTRALRERITELFRNIAAGHGLDVHPFNGGVELKSPLANKAVAVRTVMAENPNSPLAIALGDDLTDEDMFAAVNNCGGLSVLVREFPRPSSALIWIRPPAGLLKFLQRL